tara:strand:- start:128 stop:688 length:561 start_codon:yes stop_codon:yes gene_type:complete
MRIFSSAVQTIFDSDTITSAYLIKLDFNSTYYLTSHSYDLVYDGNTYLANGGLYEFDSPKFSTVIDRESYRVVISEVLDVMMTEFNSNVVGKDIEVKIALIDANGEPLLSTSDVISIYKGYVDSPSIVNDFDTKLAVIEGTSPMADLDRVNTFITSKDGMDQKSLTDTSFDTIFPNNETIIRWGKS